MPQYNFDNPIYENGKRVYSPDNPPPVSADIPAGAAIVRTLTPGNGFTQGETAWETTRREYVFDNYSTHSFYLAWGSMPLCDELPCKPNLTGANHNDDLPYIRSVYVSGGNFEQSAYIYPVSMTAHTIDDPQHEYYGLEYYNWHFELAYNNTASPGYPYTLTMDFYFAYDPVANCPLPFNEEEGYTPNCHFSSDSGTNDYFYGFGLHIPPAMNDMPLQKTTTIHLDEDLQDGDFLQIKYTLPVELDIFGDDLALPLRLRDASEFTQISVAPKTFDLLDILKMLVTLLFEGADLSGIEDMPQFVDYMNSLQPGLVDDLLAAVGFNSLDEVDEWANSEILVVKPRQMRFSSLILDIDALLQRLTGGMTSPSTNLLNIPVRYSIVIKCKDPRTVEFSLPCYEKIVQLLDSSFDMNNDMSTEISLISGTGLEIFNFDFLDKTTPEIESITHMRVGEENE